MLLNFDTIKIANVSDLIFFKVFYKGCCHVNNVTTIYNLVIANAYNTT